jgi:hypothetical protein
MPWQRLTDKCLTAFPAMERCSEIGRKTKGQQFVLLFFSIKISLSMLDFWHKPITWHCNKTLNPHGTILQQQHCVNVAIEKKNHLGYPWPAPWMTGSLIVRLHETGIISECMMLSLIISFQSYTHADTKWKNPTQTNPWEKCDNIPTWKAVR